MSLISVLKHKNNKALFTTPSHGGKFFVLHKFYQWYKHDISEVEAYNPMKALQDAERKASGLYGVKYTKFLTNGSTSGVISAIIASECKDILIWNNAHPCHKNGAELAGCNIIEYSVEFNEDLGLYKAITPTEVSELIDKYERKDLAIIITSPTYEGFASDVKTISELCHKKGVKLIVDEAHGALYPFSENLPESAVKYADYTVQSLHKTAGGINPTALLHSNDKDPSDALSKINTTSPSYPMLTTIEANINFLNSIRGKKYIDNLISGIKKLNLPLYNDDITKIILKHQTLSGFELSERLYKHGIEDERTNEKSTMLLCGIGTDDKKLQRLKKVLNNFGF
ncbi:MAG: aminotransferase class I/II-fold pyridoxal phosphate-dependent enzyme [bacterium]|nr:aminotransferase class I/II-fold pyridoxal phosphate-dependent enzyme [bacterium]